MVQLSSTSGNRAPAAGESVHRDPTRALLNSFVTAKATSLARQGELDKAADTLLPFVDSNLASDELCVLLAKIYGQQKRFEESRSMWKKALAFNPHHSEAQRILNPQKTVHRSRGGLRIAMQFSVYFFMFCIVFAIGSAGTAYYYLGSADAMSHFFANAVSHVGVAMNGEAGEMPETLSAANEAEGPNVTRAVHTLPPASEAVLAQNKQIQTEILKRLEENGLSRKHSLRVVALDSEIYILGKNLTPALCDQIKTLAQPASGAQKIEIQPFDALKTYTIQKGQSLSMIAEQHYGDSDYWTIIAEANGISNPDNIYAGQKLYLL
ncbi:MAG: LysM peptidoglycan-binding domain-containing protein [Candidatus Omnitrophica bacterium]|nr:LysM peptidoglycan-binding domain-containing protein [Candidatus Omnitrophota bacterium]